MAVVGFSAGSPGVTSYDLAVGIKISMDELIYMISPVDSPLINGVGSDGRQLLASSAVDQTEFKWMDEELLLPRAPAAGTGAAGAGVTTVAVSVADSYRFQVGDLLTIGEENVTQHNSVKIITANTNNGTLTLGNWANDANWPATAAAQQDTIICVGSALAEGSAPGDARAADRTIRSNYTQIFGPTKVEMTRTEQQITRYGVSDEFAKQLYGRSVENVITREQAYLYGQKQQDAAAKKRSTGGLNYWISSNVDSTTNTLTIGGLETLMQKCYNAGGVPDLLIANPASFADLNAISDSNRVRTVIDDPRRGRVPVSSVFHEFGETQMVRNRWCHTETAFVVQKENIQRRIIQPLIVEALAKTGDSDSVMLLCEEGLQVKGESHMAKFSGLEDYTDNPA
jgi:hypothetical protein